MNWMPCHYSKLCETSNFPSSLQKQKSFITSRWQNVIIDESMAFSILICVFWCLKILTNLEGTPCNVIEHSDKLYPWLCIWSHTIQLLINQIMHLHIKSLLEPDFLYNTPEVWVWSLQEQDRLSTISISLELSNKVAKTFTFTTRKLRLSKTPFLLFQKKWLFFTASRKKVWKVPYFHQLSHFVSAQKKPLFF